MSPVQVRRSDERRRVDLRLRLHREPDSVRRVPEGHDEDVDIVSFPGIEDIRPSVCVCVRACARERVWAFTSARISDPDIGSLQVDDVAVASKRILSCDAGGKRSFESSKAKLKAKGALMQSCRRPG
jgi:hypothetical protein